MARFMVYDSEDEGHRFPVGKAHSSIAKARACIEKRLAREAREWEATDEEAKPLYRSRALLTRKQIENSGQPNAHGKLVGMYARPWMNDWKPLNSAAKGYAYDWVYIYKVD